MEYTHWFNPLTVQRRDGGIFQKPDLPWHAWKQIQYANAATRVAWGFLLHCGDPLLVGEIELIPP
jgi:hypothetical protein